jgi:DNA-binding MarR family transcriptional regulator
MEETMDLISQLGELALASRLKRLSDRLMRDVSKVYKEQSLDFEARLFPVLFYLRAEGPSNITTIAKGLNLTHPAVTQVAHAMTRRKLVKSQRVAGDERQRELVLTEKGEKLISDIRPVWEEVATATRDLLQETKVDLVKHLERLEAALDDRNMYERVTARLKSASSASAK